MTAAATMVSHHDEVQGRPQPKDVSRPQKQPELHIAPMLDVSKREFRKLLSILSTQCVLWTDMIVDEAIANTNKLDDQLERLNGTRTNRVVCQIGGNDSKLCGEATRIVQEYGYDEVNLNIDCPSNRVCGQREFGAILMKKADVAFEVVQAMHQNSTTECPVSIKCRIGVDDWDDIEFIANFIRKLRPVCRRFVLHARKCVLDGIMTARQNRNVPPLNYPRVYELCRMFPDCDFWINGGIRTLRQARDICYGRISDNNCGCWVPHQAQTKRQSRLPCDENDVDITTLNITHQSRQQSDHNQLDGSILQASNGDSVHSAPCALCKSSDGSCTVPPRIGTVPSNLLGCMMGRAAMDNPSIFWDTDRYFYGMKSNPCSNRRQVVEQYCTYLEELYPRRCCDSDDRITYKIPVPDVVMDERDAYCDICRDMYICRSTQTTNTRILRPTSSHDTNGCDPAVSRFSQKNCKTNVDKTKNKQEHQQEETQPKIKTKIASRIVGRALKPIRGIFFGLPKSKAFLRACDEYAQDLTIRNCGPGYILRLALRVIPDEVLDRDFLKSDE